MYRNLLLLLSILILASCQNNDDTTIYISPVIGKWHIIEQYSDPGDGSGSYEPVETDEYIEFFSDGTVKSNRNICNGAVGFD